MKKNKFFSFSVCVFYFLFFIFYLVSGCGQQVAQEPTPATSGLVSITGSLYTGSIGGAAISTAGIKSQATAITPIQSYEVIAVSKNTGEIYPADAKTDSSGNFTISDLPSGESYYLEIVNNNSRLAAPVAFGASGGKAIMAIAPDAENTNLGTITFDSAEATAIPTATPTSIFDAASGVDPQSGETLVPKGAGNLGKGNITQISAGTYDSDKVDGDQDGLPNFFDADNNGDLVPDEFDGLYTREALSIGFEENPYYPYVFSNLKVGYDRRNSFKDNYAEFNLAIGLVDSSGMVGPKSVATSTKNIDNVKIVSGLPWISKAKIESTQNLWSTNNYAVPLKSSGLYEVHVDSVKPLEDVNAGDILTFRITFTDGTSLEMAKMLNFVFTDIPSVTAYKIGGGSWTADLPLEGPLTTASTSEISLRWTRPKDENNQEIMGARYTWEYNTTQEGVVRETPVVQDTDPSLTFLQATLNMMAQPNFKEESPFMIGVCIRSVANDNAAENVQFDKDW